MKGDSCTKCYHFTPIKIKKDLYAIYCKMHALPAEIDSKDTLAYTAERCSRYITEKQKKKLDKYLPCE